MAKKQATIDIADKEYTIGFNRKSIIAMEEVIGFSLAKYDETPVASAYKLFAGGLQQHHPNISIERRTELFDTYRDEGGNVEDLLGFLMEAYVDFLQTTPKPTKTINIL